jgi:hypothetical protein
VDNPFLSRAAELLRDDEAFLAVVSPEPVTHYLKKSGEAGILYDRLVLIRGTPGSGKTTMARLFEYPTLHTLLRNKGSTGYKELHAALSECRAVKDEEPLILGCRLPMESDYRDFWEFPYTDEIKTSLMVSLLQARTILGWFRHLQATGVSHDQVEMVTRPESQALLDTIGGVSGKSVAARAAEVENRIYKVITALVPPDLATLAQDVGTPYRPFDHIERIRVPAVQGSEAGTRDLIPLAIFDDAHELHPDQFQAMERFLVRRELRIARWVIARFDVLLPEQALAEAIDDRSDVAEYPGVAAGRDTVLILLQSSGRRLEQRKRFRVLAKDMASRYLRRMPLLNDKGLTVLGNLLPEAETGLTPGRLKDLGKKVDSAQSQLRISATLRSGYEKQIREYWGDKAPLPKDIAIGMLLVMMYRTEVRRSKSGPSLYDDEEEAEPDIEPSRPVAANDAVYEAALFQLFRSYERPYYFGIDAICDAGSENAEQFLRLSAELVEAVVTQLARSKPPSLSPLTQHKLLRETADRIMEKWSFPQDSAVRRMVMRIADECLNKSLEPNGAVIASAFGIPQAEFDALPKNAPVVARVLQFAVAYNAITLVPHHNCQGEVWCLLELGGVALLKNGLTLKRGGFIKGTAPRLREFIAEDVE